MKTENKWPGLAALARERANEPAQEGGITKQQMDALKRVFKKGKKPVQLYRLLPGGSIERITVLIFLLILAAGHATAGEPQGPSLCVSQAHQVLGHETRLRNDLARVYRRPATDGEVYAAYNLGFRGFRRCGFRVERTPAATRAAVKQIMEGR